MLGKLYIVCFHLLRNDYSLRMLTWIYINLLEIVTGSLYVTFDLEIEPPKILTKKKIEISTEMYLQRCSLQF